MRAVNWNTRLLTKAPKRGLSAWSRLLHNMAAGVSREPGSAESPSELVQKSDSIASPVITVPLRLMGREIKSPLNGKSVKVTKEVLGMGDLVIAILGKYNMQKL